MSAGSGNTHAEYNQEDETTRLFQILIVPTQRGGNPSWGAQPFPKGDRSGRFVTLASGFAEDSEALPIRTEARVLGATLKAGETTEYALGADRHAYLVPASGKIEINGVPANARDGIAISDTETLTVTALEDSELVMVDAA
jgi:redox-sensitive bicupin YhaK (pirin superfamily)